MTDAVKLTEAEWRQVDDAIVTAPELIRDAAGSLDFVADVLDAGALDARDCVGVLRLAARGLRAGEAGGVAALGLVERELRRVRSVRLQAKREAEIAAEVERIVKQAKDVIHAD